LADLDRTAGSDGADAAGRAGRVPLPPELRAFWIVSVIGFALTFVVGWLKWHAGEGRFNWDPLSDRIFFDLNEYPGTYTLLHSRAFFFNFTDHPWPYPMWNPVAYPPFAAVVMAPLYAFPIPELLFMIVSGVWLVAVVWWARRALLRSGIGPWTAALLPVTLVAMSFPIARLIHQGNIELVVWMFTALGVWAFMQRRDDAAAVLWGLAAAMKLFPLILLILLLPRGRYRAFAVGVATFVGATIVSLWWLGPTVGVAWSGSLKNVFGYQGVRAVEWSIASLATNHSLIEFAKLAAQTFSFPQAKVVLPYYVAGMLVMAFIFLKKLWKMPEANQLLGVSAFMLMYPSISYYHTLVHMYAPFAVLAAVAIRAAKVAVTVRGLKAAMLLFVPLFASFTVLTYPSALIFCGLVQAMVLLVLLLMAAEYPFAVEAAQAKAA
jgi:hypothetical protein